VLVCVKLKALKYNIKSRGLRVHIQEAQFESQPGDQLYWLRLSCFPSSAKQMLLEYLIDRLSELPRYMQGPITILITRSQILL
jgi:hypothetical protein